jgi:molybdate transport repressor ModE-like protein
MSYKAAWDAVDSMNALAVEPLVERVTGGRGGGFTRLTPYGLGLVERFGEVEAAHRRFLAALEYLQRVQGMHVVLVGHSLIKAFRNPEGDDFDRYTLKLHDKAAALCREWCDGVYFAQFETFSVKDKTKRVKGVSTGARLLFTQRTAAFDAKDRYGLPDRLALDWNEFQAAAAKPRAADIQTMVEIIKANADSLGGDLKGQTLELLAKAGGDAEKVAKLMTWTQAKLGLKTEKETT